MHRRDGELLCADCKQAERRANTDRKAKHPERVQAARRDYYRRTGS
jgi:hypothetical protein